jgi:sporulation related protein/PilZ domain-containing protein
MIQERRSYSRKTLNPLPYISLTPDNGGIVLDVSEQGLRFRATAPVEPSGPIRFSFSAHSDLVEGVADLVWTDRAKKTGGLRFTELSDDAREVIRKWPHESDLRLSVGQDFMLQIPASGESSRTGAPGRGAFDATLQFASSWSMRFGSAFRECLQFGRKEGLASLNALRLESHFKERKRSLLVAFSMTVVVILLSTLAYVRHREVGEWLVRLGTRISGEGRLQTVMQAPPSTLSMQPPGVGEMSGDKSKVDATQEHAAPQPTYAASPLISKGNASGPSLPQAPTANVRPLTPAAHGGELVVQVAALTREADAREMVDSLRHKNFQAFVRTLPADALYRVMLGPYANTTAARLAVDKLKKAGFDSFVRREPGAELSGALRIPTP